MQHKKIIKHLFFIIVIVVLFSFLTMNLIHMFQAKGLNKTISDGCYNYHYNIYKEYKLELTLLISAWLGSLFLFMYHVNKLCYWGYEENESEKGNGGNHKRFSNSVKKQTKVPDNLYNFKV